MRWSLAQATVAAMTTHDLTDLVGHTGEGRGDRSLIPQIAAEAS
jgi:hypothetical protein